MQKGGGGYCQGLGRVRAQRACLSIGIHPSRSNPTPPTHAWMRSAAAGPSVSLCARLPSLPPPCRPPRLPPPTDFGVGDLTCETPPPPPPPPPPRAAAQPPPHWLRSMQWGAGCTHAEGARNAMECNATQWGTAHLRGPLLALDCIRHSACLHAWPSSYICGTGRQTGKCRTCPPPPPNTHTHTYTHVTCLAPALRSRRRPRRWQHGLHQPFAHLCRPLHGPRRHHPPQPPHRYHQRHVSGRRAGAAIVRQGTVAIIVNRRRHVCARGTAPVARGRITPCTPLCPACTHVRMPVVHRLHAMAWQHATGS